MQKLIRVLEATRKGPLTAPSARLAHDLTYIKETTASAGNHHDFQPGTGSSAGGSWTSQSFRFRGCGAHPRCVSKTIVRETPATDRHFHRPSLLRAAANTGASRTCLPIVAGHEYITKYVFPLEGCTMVCRGLVGGGSTWPT